MNVDWSKPIQTRDGRKAQYLGRVDDGHIQPNVVAVFTNGITRFERHYDNGAWTKCPRPGDEKHDILNVPEKCRVTGVLNVFDGFCTFHNNQHAADADASCYSNRLLAQVPLDLMVEIKSHV